jgi:hypothetical protein
LKRKRKKKKRKEKKKREMTPVGEADSLVQTQTALLVSRTEVPVRRWDEVWVQNSPKN